MDLATIETYLQYLPTAIVTLILGLIAQKVVREGKKDETQNQIAANRLQETQQLLDGQNVYIDSLKKDLDREHNWRLDAEDQAHRLRELVVAQIDVTAQLTYEPEHTKE